MENLKVKSDLIDGTGINEDVFAALNTPDSHIFSLQRFANSGIILDSGMQMMDATQTESASNAKVTKIITNGITNDDVFSKIFNSETFAYGSLGTTATSSGTKASTDQYNQTTWSAYKLDKNKALAMGFDSTVAESITEEGDSTVEVYALNLASSDALSIKYDDNTNNNGHLLKNSGDKTYTLADLDTGGPSGYWVYFDASGLRPSNATSATLEYSVRATSYDQFSDATAIAATNNTSKYSNTIKWSGNITSPTDDPGMWLDFFQVQGGTVWAKYVWTTSESKQVTQYFAINAYDMYVQTMDDAEKTTGFEDGSFVANLYGEKPVLSFKAQTAIGAKPGVNDKTFTINGWDVTFAGISTSLTLTAAAYSADKLSDAFSTYTIGPNETGASIAFAFTDANSKLTLGSTFTNAEDSGTVQFNYNSIGLLNSGSFTVDASTVDADKIFYLDSGATGTFKLTSDDQKLLLGVADNINNLTDLPVVSFTGTAGATVIGMDDSSNLTLAGTFSAISGTSVFNGSVGFILSDTSNAKIGNYTFEDKGGDQSSTFVHFTSPSDITIGGVFANIYSETEKGLTNVSFKLQDSTTAKLGVFTFSDTADGKTSLVQFQDASNTILLAGSIAASDSRFANATFTLASQTGKYTINGKEYTAKNDGTEATNQLSFISGTVDFSDTFADWAQTAIGKDQAVTGINAGTNINFDTSTAIDIAAGNAQILQGYYFGGNGTDASGTVKFSNTAKVLSLTGNLNVSAASGTKLIGLDGETFTATAGSFFIADSGTVKVNGLTFVDASDGYVSFAEFGNTTNVTLHGSFANVYSGTVQTTPFANFGFTLADSATAKFPGGFSFSDTANGENSYVKFGGDTNTFVLSGAMAASGTFTNATFTLSDVAVYNINGQNYNVNEGTFSEAANKLQFISTNLTVGDAFSNVNKDNLILQNVTGVSVGANVGLATGTTNIAASQGLLINGYYFGTQKDATASGTVTFSDTSGKFDLTGNLNVALASGTELIGLNTQSFTATQGSFYIADTGSILVNSFTFKDASDSFVSKLTFDGAGSALTLAGSMGVTGEFVNGATALLSNVGSYTLNADAFTVGTAGNGDANKVTILSTTLTTDATHQVFAIDNRNVTGFTAGSNITIGQTTIAEDKAKLLGGYYFAGNGTVKFSTASDINLTGTLTVDQVGTGSNSSTLLGLSSTKFDAAAGTYTFFLADEGTGTAINGLSFSDFADDSVTKLVAAYGSTSSMSVFGSAILASGSDTNMVFTLNSTTGLAEGALQFANLTNPLKFEGNGVSVKESTTSLFNLTAVDSGATMFVTGAADAATNTFALQTGSAGYFQIGSAIIGNSGTELSNAIDVVAAGKLASNTALANLTIGGDIVKVVDAAGSETYKIDLKEGSMNGATISQIDGGAFLYQISSATSVITTGNGTFTFSGTALTDAVSGTNTQIFSILNDKDGVTFGLDSGMVVSISGIDEGATVSVTDLTIADVTKNINGVTKTGNQLTNGTWARNVGQGGNAWAADQYLGYIINSTGADTYKVQGIESSVAMNRADIADYSTLVGTTATGTFTLNNNVFTTDGLQQVTFLNSTEKQYSASYSGTTLFKNLGTTDANHGVMFESGSSVISFASIGNVGTATALTSLDGVSSSLSLTLANYALNVYDGYNVSGTGVAVTADSSTVTVNANGKSAIVGMPDAKTIAFGANSSGTYLINGLSTHTFTVDATAGAVAGTNSAVFALSLANGAAVTDTLTQDAASALSINELTYSLVGDSTSSTFAFKADKPTLNITSGILAITGEIGSYTTANFAFTEDAGLVLGHFTHTAVEDATFTLSNDSGTQLANVKAGMLKEDVSSGTAFFFNNNLYTATSAVASFNADSNSNTLLKNSTAIGNMATTGTHIVTIGTFEDVFTMDSGSTVELSYDAGSAYNAKWNYTSGTGTLSATNTQTFAVSDFYLTGGQTGTATDSPFVYTASDAGAVLSLALNGDMQTITFNSGGGTRSDTATTFTFNDNPYTTTSEGLTYYIGEGSATSAAGVVYKGAGTREFSLASDSALLTGADALTYHSNTYTFADGLINIDIDKASGTFTAGAGSATWFASAANTQFYFDYNENNKIDANELYTAKTQDSNTALYALVDSASKVTGLYNAIGAGTREGSGTYVVDVLDNASYTMANDATVLLTFSGTATAPSILANETFTSGTGILNVAVGSSFAIAQAFIDGTSNTSTIADADIFRYTASDTSKLTLTLDGTNTKISFTTGFATRSDTKENAATFDFGGNAYTSTSNELTFFMSADSNTNAAGYIYNGVGTRPFEVGSETFNVTHLGDTYSVTGGTYTLSLTNGASDLAVTAGTASATFVNGDTFHFSSTYGSFAYVSTTDTKLGITFTNGTNTTLVDAIGAGTRTLDTQTTFAISALNDATYTFDKDAMALLTIDKIDSYSETAYAGTGYMTATSTFTAAFDANGAYTSGTSYAYTASGSAVLSAGFAAGELTSQTLVNGAAIRSGASDTSFVYALNGGIEHTYTNTDVAGSSFILNSDTAKTYGAAGLIYTGAGTRAADDKDSFTSIYGNDYKALAGSATYKLTLTKGDGTEGIWSVSTTQTFDNTFFFKGTQYTSDENSKVTLALVFNNGATDTQEVGLSGAGSFNTTDSGKTFAYDGNTYYVDSSVGAVLSVTFDGGDASQVATFVKGKGNIDNPSGGNYVFIEDSNTYTMGAYVASISKDNETSTVVHSLTSGSGTLNTSASNGMFNYAYNGVMHQYSDTGKAVITLVGDPDGASATFTGGSGQRIDSTTNLAFTFDGNNYTSTGKAITFTLELSDTTVPASLYEHATSGSGTRTVNSSFAYESPISKQTETYTGNATLDLVIVDGEGTETFMGGTATRVIDAGTTFAVAPDKFAFASASDTMTFTATQQGTYTLTAKNDQSGMLPENSEMLFMGYNVDVVTEDFTDGVGTGTAVSPFNYTSKVTSQTETYTGDGVVFEVTVAGGANTATWLSGSATMKLDANRTFVFDSPTDSQSYTYTVETTAGFTRTGEDVEFISSGAAFRTTTAKVDAFTILDSVSNTYTADAGAQIKLTESGTTGAEAFNAGSATFTAATGGTFNYDAANADSHTYNVTADVTMQALVKDGAFGSVFSAVGAGTRGFDASETTTHDVLGDGYTVDSGTFTLTLSTGDFTESETLTAGSGIFSTTSTFHVNDFYLGNSTATSTGIEYTAVGSSGVTLALTVANGSETIAITSGLGTRDVNTDTFLYNNYTYSVSGTSIAYAISADSQTSAAGYLYNAVATRDGADSNTTFVFNEDKYTAENGTMRLTVTEGKATEDMFAGTATYKAETGDVFHFNYNDKGLAAYTATAVSNLTATFENGDTSSAKFASITATGTRLATAGDTGYTLEYMSDTYSAVAGSSTILFTAGGVATTATETIKEDAGIVQFVVDTNADKTFHNNTTGNWYEYTAQSGTTISLALDNASVQSFSENPFALRTDKADSGTVTFKFTAGNNGTEQEYTATEVGYLLTGTGTALSEAVNSADQAYRNNGAGESYTTTTMWNNVYTLTSGTYTMNVANGVGTETLTAGAGTATYEKGKSFNYNSSNTSFIANVEGATLGVTIENSTPTEKLTAGSAFDGTETYIAVDGAKVTLEGATTDATLTLTATNSDTIIGLTATAFNASTYTGGLTSAKNLASFAADVDTNGDVAINGKRYSAVAAGTLTGGSALDSFSATSVFTATGNFTDNNNPTLAGKKIDVTGDTELSVAFSTADGIATIDHLTDGIKVNDAAGATKAITDSTGKFIFNSTLEGSVNHTQTFNISGGDNSVTFQIDNTTGLVTGIAGIDAESGNFEIRITDTDTTEEVITDVKVGQILTRDSDTGLWASKDVEAVSYIVDLESENSLTVYAVDASSDTTKIDYSKIGSVTSDTAGNYTVNVNSDVISDTKAIIVTNTSDKNINFTGAVTVGAVGSMTGDAVAIQLDTDTTANGAFKTGSISNNKFNDSNSPYTVTGGIFNVGAEGVITVNADDEAVITANEGSTNVNLLADTDAGTFKINDGPVVTLKVADSDGKGIYNATLTGSSVTGLKSTPGNDDGVATGTVIIPTAAEGTTFNIENASVSVTSDTGSMTFEIKDDKLAGISDVSTDAVLNVSGTSDELSINGDTDNKVTPVSDTPIKFNKTQQAWVSGDAAAIAANGYVVSVTAGGELQLWYTTSATTVPAQTTNKADYAKVFGNYALAADDAELPTYGDAISLNTLNTDVKVSVSAGLAAGVAVTTSEDKDLALVTATGNYTINSQELIPSAQVTVSALAGTGAQATVSSAVTIGHDGMNISGATTTTVQATFGANAIDLTNSAKVTNTNNTTTFNVQGNVTFDGIGVMTGHESKVVTGVNATVAPSGLTIDGNDLNVTGGDLAYTVDVSNDTDTIIIGINGDATVGGTLASDAQILTASTGVFKVASSNELTISGDESVTLTTSNDSVDGILGLNGTATGNFSQAVTVNTGSVLIMGDDTVAVTGNDSIVTAIDGVGADNLDETAVIANAGGASVVNADKNGNFQFGSSDINRQRYTVDDGDSVVSFYTSSLADYTPKVTAVSGLNTGTIAIAQNEKGLVIDGNAITLGGVVNEVTVTAADSSIVAVNGLEGSVNGLASSVLAQAVDSDVTINGAAMVINEGENGTTLVATASEGGFNAVAGLNAGATVYTAKSADIMTEGEGAFTFDKNNATYTISGDSEVDFITDSQSRVSDITNFNGNLQMTATSTKVNGSTVSIARESTDAAVSDVTIAGTGSGVGAISGLGSGDSVTAPAGAQVAMPGSSDSDTASALTVNGKKFSLYGDSDTVTITPGATGSPDSINGLDPGAKLVFNNTAGTYNVNGEVLTVGVGATVVGDAEGTAHVYDPKDVDIDGDKDSVDDIVKKVTGSTAADDDRYVENLSSDDGNKLAAEIASGNTSNANGNIQMQLTNTTNDSVQTADFSQTTGIKKVSLEGGAQDVKFNDAGGNIAYIGDDATGAKNVELGNGGDIVAIGSTDAEVNVKAGKGQDQIVSKAANTKADLSAGGPTKLMATGYGAHIETTGYDHNTGAGIQTTNNNIKQAIKTNTIQLNNGLVTTNGATTRTNADTAEGTSVVNLYNLKGLMTKVGYTHNDGGELDMSSEHSDVVLKGNYTDYGAQTKGGSSKLLGGLGNDYILAGANDEIDAGAGDNSIELDSAPRNANAAGATINQTATTGRTEVTGFNNEFGTTGDKLNISGSAKVSFAGGVLRFLLGAAELVIRGISSRSGSSADLAESADEDDTATTVSGSTNYAPLNINGVNTAIIAENQWIGGSEALWSADSIPTAYVGSGSGAGIDLRNMDANVDMVLSGANDANSTGVFGTTNVDFRGINKVRLGNGSSTVRGTADVNNTIVAGLGASSVWGGGVSDDTFIGRQTSLKSGADTFFYVNGDGADVISNFEFRTAENGSTADKINVLDAVVTGASVSGQDVLVNLTGDHDRLTIKNAVGQDFQVEYGNVGAFETLTAQVNYDSLNFDGRAGYYQAINKNAALVASSELDSAEIWLNNNRDFSKNTFVGDFKVLNASNVAGRSTLVGNSNDNTIIGSSENSSMWGGDKGGNDTLVGGAGTDMFWYGKNNGSDTVTQVDENDVVNLYDVNIADVENYDDWVITNNSVSFNLKESAGGGSLTIQSNNVGFGIKFADDANTYAINQRDRSYHTK